MCGFVGYRTLHQHMDDEAWSAAAQTIYHRGPDDGGSWISNDHTVRLAARRLSIVDLSDAGAQPMLDNQKDVVLTFNGEIYNHHILRAKLKALGYVFRSNTDTEVVLHAYKQWGMAFLDRLDGMFAIAIYDQRSRKIFLIRDRIGIKPLYFSLQGDTISFASEMKALWKLPWMKKKISPKSVYHYLTYLATPAPMTMYEKVYKLPAGFYATVSSHNEIDFTQWYDPKDKLAFEEQYTKEFFCMSNAKNLLIDAVAKRIPEDVPSGVLLSGGLDSSLIVALMAQHTKNIQTFNVSFDTDANHEREWARKVAKQFGTDHHELIITEQEAFSFMQKMVYHQDEPLGDSVCIPLYFVSKMASDAGVKVVQVGEGADELFCGYPMYVDYLKMQRLWQMSQKYIPRGVRKGLFYAARPLYESNINRQDAIHAWSEGRDLFWGGVRVFSELWKQDIMRMNFDQEEDLVIAKMFPQFPLVGDSYDIIDWHRKRFQDANSQADFYSMMTYIELKHRLPELLLTRTDKMTMAASVEARVPFLDYRLVEHMLQVPIKYKYKNNQTKCMLKTIAESFLPHDVIYRKKVGFAAPVTHWFKKGTMFGEHLHDAIRSETWADMLDVAKIDQMFLANRTSRYDYSYQLWALQNLVASVEQSLY